jgi:hypothetical protein
MCSCSFRKATATTVGGHGPSTGAGSPCFSDYTSCPITHTVWLSPGAFLFSVVNPHGDPPCAFPLRSSDEPRAICEPKRVVPNVCCCCYLCSSFSVFARLRGGIRTHIRHRRPRGQLQRAPSPVVAHAKCAGGRRHENGTHRVPPRLRGRSGPVRHLRWLQ